MRVLVRDRRSGKTTELIRWLLQGHEQIEYPSWTRVIVVPKASMVPFTTRMVWAATMELSDRYICQRALPHLREGCEVKHEQLMADIRKAVWSLRDLDHNLRGSRNFEYGLDDADEALSGNFLSSFLVRPAVITMTGEAVDSLCD